MEKKNKFAVIGTGMMGSSILAGILKKEIFDPKDVCVYDVDAQRLATVSKELGVKTAGSSVEAVANAETVLIAVKPQTLPALLAELKNQLPVEAAVLSIVVGVPVRTLQEQLNHAKVVRIMPNTPAQIGEGVSGWFATDEVTAEQRALVKAALEAIGLAFEVKEEKELDEITAVSGSGPAYVFLFMEAMIDAAVHIGLPRAAATRMVAQTVKGSADYLLERGAHPAVLKNEVTSPGGTTAEALYYFEREGFRGTVAKAMWACFDRTKQLGNGEQRETGPLG